jgi:hypothetical protein
MAKDGDDEKATALPALRHALSDASPDVRRFAQLAIGSIEGNSKSSTYE